MSPNILGSNPLLALAVIAFGAWLVCVSVIAVVDKVFGKGTAGLALAWTMGVVIGSVFIWEQTKTLLTLLSVITGGTNPERF